MIGCFSVTKSDCSMPVSSVLHYLPAAAAAKSLQLGPTLCHPIDGSPPGFPVYNYINSCPYIQSVFLPVTFNYSIPIGTSKNIRLIILSS